MEPSRKLEVFSDLIEKPTPSKKPATIMEPESQRKVSDMDEKPTPVSQTMQPESSNSSSQQIPLLSKQNGTYASKGSRTVQFYHYADYTLDYSQISLSLTALADVQVKGASAVLSVIRDLVRTGLRNPEASIDNLEHYVEHLKYGELEEFLYQLLPKIAKWALEAEMFFPERLPLGVLEQDHQRELTLSRFQVLCMMSLSFFGLFPDTTSPDLPQHRLICFLFYKSRHDNHIKLEKLKFIMEYFRQMAKPEEAKLIDPSITYSRRGLNSDKVSQMSFWSSQPGDLSEVEFNNTDSIESYDEALQVDFANK